MENSLLTVESTKSGWKVRQSLENKEPQSIAVDPVKKDLVYCAMYNDGLWKSEDCGENWKKIGREIRSPNTMAVAVAPSNNKTVAYAGTEPSSLYRSDDKGNSWSELEGLTKLASSKMWSFPPRPETHHVRWIAPDANSPDHLYVAIEAGALVQSFDGGRTWMDKVSTGPFDTHTLATHKKAPGRVYSSAGDGYFESYDSGKTWNRMVSGLGHRYVYGLALDPSNPENVVISSASSAYQAHYPGGAESFIYVKGDIADNWRRVSEGFPEPEGTFVSILSASPNGEIYALNNKGVFCSSDSGSSWVKLEIPWQKEFLKEHPWALAATS